MQPLQQLQTINLIIREKTEWVLDSDAFCGTKFCTNTVLYRTLYIYISYNVYARNAFDRYLLTYSRLELPTQVRAYFCKPRLNARCVNTLFGSTTCLHQGCGQVVERGSRLNAHIRSILLTGDSVATGPPKPSHSAHFIEFK